MAGLSQRFRDAGYKLPKYMLTAHGQSIFAHSVLSFRRYFDTDEFVFVVRDVEGTRDFVDAQAQTLGIRRFSIVTLDAPTRGQAETVALGLRQLGPVADQNLLIFNIDTFRPGFELPDEMKRAGGALEVFRGTGDNWSFARPASSQSSLVVETSEKRPISDLCCTGMYYFREVDQYLSAYDRYESREAAAMGQKELYVAPMYNILIRDGLTVRYWLIASDKVIFCGVPREYEEFRSREEIR